MGAAAGEEAFDGAHVGEVAAAGDHDVAGGDEAGVGRVVVDPAGAGDENGDPGVRGIGAAEAGFAGRGSRE